MSQATRLLHISDLHAGPQFQPEVAEALLTVVQELDLQAITVSGDLTQRARVGQFAEVSRWLGALPELPLAVVPGNHDVPLYRFWERVFSPHMNFNHMRKTLVADKAPEEYPFSLDVGSVRLVCLDSTAPLRALKGGRLASAQLDQAARLLSAPGHVSWRAVVVHHNLLNPPGLKHHSPMPRAQEIMARLEGMSVDVVLSGHLHQAFVSQTLDVHAGEDRSRGMVICNCGTSTSRRGRGAEREKNSFNVLTFGDDAMLRVQHWIYFESPRAFREVSAHEFKFIPGRHATDM